MSSTAFFHSLTICGYMLCITKEVARDLHHRRAAMAEDTPQATGAQAVGTGVQRVESGSSGESGDVSVTLALAQTAALDSGAPARPASRGAGSAQASCNLHTRAASGGQAAQASGAAGNEDLSLGPDAHVLLEVAPKVQATGCRCACCATLGAQKGDLRRACHKFA